MKRSAASTPRTDPSWPTSSAMRWLVSPKPQPMSSARSLGRGGWSARACSPCAPRPLTRTSRYWTKRSNSTPFQASIASALAELIPAGESMPARMLLGSRSCSGDRARVHEGVELARQVGRDGLRVHELLERQALHGADQRGGDLVRGCRGRGALVLEARLDRRRVRAPQVRLAARVARPQARVARGQQAVLRLQEDEVALLGDEPGEKDVRLRGHVLLRRRGLELGDRLAHATVDAFLEQREEEVVVAVEVPVDGALREAGARGDLLDRRRLKALLGEDLRCRLEELLASVAALRAPCARSAIDAGIGCSHALNMITY